jgi:hypothetical protein
MLMDKLIIVAAKLPFDDKNPGLKKNIRLIAENLGRGSSHLFLIDTCYRDYS